MTNATPIAVEDLRGTVPEALLAADGFGLRRRVHPGAVVVLRARRARTVAAALRALEGWASRVDLVGTLEPGEVPSDAVQLDDAATEAPVPDDTPRIPGGTEPTATRWRLFTSGTTGTPKPVEHTLASLTRTVRRPDPGTARGPRRWGLLYEPTRMAGLQVLLQSLAGGDHLLDATAQATLPERLRWLADREVEALSATPTVWRQVLQSPDRAALPLTQITLGGEIADQRVLDALAHTYPAARITHIFASTETGAAFAVNDGREGFPASYLTAPPKGVRLDVRDGVLHVHAPDVSGAAADGFVSTGDLVEVGGDRVRFLGRASGLVNVGGVMVSPESVEAVLRGHPEVTDAVVRSRPNPFSGTILVADVVPGPTADRKALPALLRAEVAGRLSAAHVPASIKVVAEMVTTATGKAGRR
ncbi:AMP-binding protein [Modestobacter roseus]|uniref:Long-chain-fatty-acid--CoA ligase n=1 Tax=Modestobacter roseus TaxID=1181884 RepID=A0A562IXT8_9ACTN|nr:class I adenylate-forming enzyme family protein [Modestobacter roseus]MQA34031.1 AMP-binding protein [Modestobacter roseus]TWH75394.1 acyl-CoA synthetase (AMP-forming)/AMP-acid ligase II [Modestobacter roseus]